MQRGNHYISIFADKIFDCATGSWKLPLVSRTTPSAGDGHSSI
jgi:hypothetical protein